jgi:hypothetical protein
MFIFMNQFLVSYFHGIIYFQLNNPYKMTGNHPGTENIKERHFQDWILSV